MARPLLDPPASGWKRDLTGPNDPPETTPSPKVISHPPNHADDIYMELPRSTLLGRGVIMWVGFFVSLAGLFFLVFFVCTFDMNDVGFLLISAVAVLVAITSGVSMIRQDLAPRDEPIRFNRLRRKVYVYRYHHEWGLPFSNKRWGVRPATYDWSDLRAEECGIYVPTMAYNQTVNIAVVKPGTNQVIDRFILSHDAVEGAHLWAMAQLFMQQGPHALPKFDRPPRDWNNEDPGLNLARRFAPKVKWPHDMDIESRTAP